MMSMLVGIQERQDGMYSSIPPSLLDQRCADVLHVFHVLLDQRWADVLQVVGLSSTNGVPTCSRVSPSLDQRCADV